MNTASPFSSGVPRLPALLWLLLVILLALTGFLFTTATPWLGLVVAVGLVFLATFMRLSAIWFFLVIALLPFSVLRTLPPPFDFIKIDWLLSFFLLLNAALALLLTKRSFTPFASNLWFPILLFLAVNAVSALLSPFGLIAIKNCILFLVVFLFFSIILYYLSVRSFIRTLPYVIIFSISLSSLLSVTGKFFSLDFLVQEGSMRALALTGNPNYIAIMALIALPLIVHFIDILPGSGPKFGFSILAVVNVLGLISSDSRGGALGFLILSVLLLAKYLPRISPRLFGLFLAGLGITITVMLLMTPESFWQRQASLFDKYKDASLSRRYTYLLVGWEIFKEYPILGTGPLTFRETYATTDYAKRFHRDGSTLRRFAHNTYLEVLTGSGLVGLAFFLLLLARAYVNFTQASRRLAKAGDDEAAGVIDAYRLSFTILLIYLLIFSDTYYKFLYLFLACSTIAMRLAAATDAGQPDQDSTDGSAGPAS